jgi:hypothetical protein
VRGPAVNGRASSTTQKADKTDETGADQGVA